VISVTSLEKAFGGRHLFRGADLRIGARDRLALVGPNGSGKTTLLEMIGGLQEPDGGSITIGGGAQIGYLKQETDHMRGRTVLEEVLSAGSEVVDTGRHLGVLEAEIGELSPGSERDRVVAEYGRLQDRYHTLGGYSHEALAKRILAGLGFQNEDHDRLTESLSGGWMMRIALAKLLLAEPDLLMLDEPTNHLDVESVEWLERYLAAYDGAVLLISHDRDFIDGMASRIVEIFDERLWSYTGNFEAFVRQKEEALVQAEQAAAQQARRRAQLETFVNRFRYKKSKARQVQSKIKLLDRMEEVDVPEERRRSMRFTFPTPPRPGRVVVELAGLSFSYGNRPVYEDLDLAIERGQKVALVGPNGAGKSTLLKLFAGALTPQEGERRLGHNTAVGYFAQHRIDALDPSKRVIEEISGVIPADVHIKPRSLLGRFLFSGDDVNKSVSVLSGGERTRLALAKLLVQPFNLLCMDEPTNHLDMWSRDVLEDALEEYQGALVLITHDRHLIRAVADNILVVVDGETTWFHGDYDYYLDRRERSEEEPEGSPTTHASGPRGKERRRRAAAHRARTQHLRNEIGRIEEELDHLGAERDSLSALFADPSVYAGDEDLPALATRYEGIQKRIRDLEERWETAAGDLETIESEVAEAT